MLRKARISDAIEIVALMRPYVEKEIILKKSQEEIIERIRDFFVWEENNTLLGCAAFYPGWEGLGEIRSTAVSDQAQKKGIGTQLVQGCIDEAKQLGVPRIFALTYESAFFSKLGFTELDKHDLPQKIFKDCLRCSRFLDCDETAMVMDLPQ